MAQLNTYYYQGNDQYSDGDVEERILQIVQEGKSLEESGDRSFSVLYHLSHIRENILSWYPFREGASALEIGAGPGAVTGLLCRKCACVTSVELSLRRARINYERNRSSDNLTIMVGNLNDMSFPEKFDYVILNGVFEYAGSFTEGEDPFGTFLKRCAGYLKEDGLLLIAIENRLGLKYFSGAPEDHTENYMEGLRDYPDNSAVHTFSRGEWESLLDRCGLPFRKFYYPYPDYKFPNEIFTGRSLRAESFGKNAWNFDPDRVELFSEQEMGETLCAEGVMERFMNSFLIETGSERAGHARGSCEVLYARISADRAEEFRIQTVILRGKDGKKRVIKSALNEKAKEHLKRMHEREMQSLASFADRKRSGVRSILLSGTMCPDGALEYPFLEGGSLARRTGADASSIRSACRELLAQIQSCRTSEDEYTEAFTKLFGTSRPEGERLEMVCPANIDLIFDNIFPAGDHDDVIDGEWIVDTPVPALFLLWRAVNELYCSRKELERVLPQETLLKEFGISAGNRQVFWRWASHFEKEYVKANSLAAYAAAVRRVDLRDLRWSGQDVRLTSTLYMDRGMGFREEDALHMDVVLEKGRFDASFEIERPQEVRALRFDPLEGSACVCSLACDAGSLKPVNASAFSRAGAVFLTMDPAYRVGVRDVPEKIRFTGSVRLKDLYWALEKSQKLLGISRLGPVGRAVKRIIRRVR